MRILHLYSNYKWTGPADPAIRCAYRLRELGLDVQFTQASWCPVGSEHRMREELWKWRMPVISGLQLPKHFRLRALREDVRLLRMRLVRERYDVLHCHQPTDHLAAALATLGLSRRTVVVRTLYDPDPPRRGLRFSLALRRTNGLVLPTEAAARGMVSRFGYDRERLLVQEPVVEARRSDGPDLRTAWGLDSSHFVVGITARVQPHRRFDLLWDITRRMVDQLPNARVVLLGRGNDHDLRTLVHEPVERLGLRGHVILPGYQMGADYDAALRSLDAFLFLVPGSDGTCRAVREAMAQGIPVVTTRRGILPELMRATADGRLPGSCHDEDPASMSQALVCLGADSALRNAAGSAARDRTLQEMDPRRAATVLHRFYLKLLG